MKLVRNYLYPLVLLIYSIFCINEILSKYSVTEDLFYLPLLFVIPILFIRKLNLLFILSTFFILIYYSFLTSFLLAAISQFAIFSFGNYFLNRFKINTIFNEYIISYFLGIGLICFILNFLILTNFNTIYSYTCFLLFSILINYKKNLELCFAFKNFFIKNVINQTYIDSFQSKTYSIILLILFIIFLQTFLPHTSYDSFVTHIYIPSYIFSNHSWIHDPELLNWSLQPKNYDLYNTYSFFFGGIHTVIFSNLILLTLFLFLLKKVFLSFCSNQYENLFVLFVLSMPITLIISINLFSDLFLTIFIFLAFSFLLYDFLNKKFFKEDHLLLGGFFLGIAIGTKFISIIFLFFYSLFFIYLFLIKSIKLKHIVYLFILISIIGIFTYLNSFLLTGNPFFPYFNNFFGSIYFPNVNFDNPIYSNNFNLLSIFDLTFSSNKFYEYGNFLIGFILLICFFILIIEFFSAKNEIQISLLFLFVLPFITSFYFQQYYRYLYLYIPIFLLFFFIIIGANGVFVSVISNYIFKLFSVIFIIFHIPLILLNTHSPEYLKKFSNLDSQLVNNNIENNFYLRSYSTINKYFNKTHNIGIISWSFPAGFIESNIIYANWYNDYFSNYLYQVKNKKMLLSILNQYEIDGYILDRNFNPGNSFPHLYFWFDEIGDLIDELSSHLFLYKINENFNNFLYKNNYFELFDNRINLPILIYKDKYINKNLIIDIDCKNFEENFSIKYFDIRGKLLFTDEYVCLSKPSIKIHDIKNTFKLIVSAEIKDKNSENLDLNYYIK